MAVAPSAPRRKPERNAVVKAPTTQLGALNDVMSHVEFGQNILVPAIEQTTQEILRAKSSLIDTTKALAVEREPWRDKIRHGLDRLQNMEQNPEIINKVLGIIDEDFNRDAMIRQVQTGKFELNQITNRMVEAETLHGLEVGMAKTALAGAQSFYSFTREGNLDTQSAILAAFDIRQGVRKEQVQLVESTTSAQLTKWEANPDIMPPKLRGLERLVTAELYHRDVKEKQLDALDISTTMAQQSLDATSRERWFNQHDSVEDLGAAKQRFISDPNSAPPFIQLNDFDVQAQSRQMINLDLRTAQVAAEAGEMQLRNVKVQEAFVRSSALDLDRIKLEMGEENVIELLPGLMITKTELDLAIQGKEDANFKLGVKRAELQILINGMEESMTGAGSKAWGLSHLNGPGGKVPSKARAALQTAQNMHPYFAAHAAAGSQPDAVAMSKLWKVADDTLETVVKDVVDNAPKSDAAGLASYIRDEGVMTTGAVSYGYGNLTNEFWAGYDPVLNLGAAAYGRELGNIIGTQSLNFAQSETGFSFDSNEKEKGSRLNQAVIDSDVRAIASDSGFQFLLQSTLQELTLSKQAAGPNEGPEYDPNSPFASLITPRGTLAFGMYGVGETGEKEFLYGNFYKLLATAQLTGVANGTLQPGNDLVVPIIDMINEMAPSLNERFTLSPQAAALKEIAFPNGMQDGIYKRSAKVLEKVPKIILDMEVQKAAMKEAIQQEIDDREQTP